LTGRRRPALPNGLPFGTQPTRCDSVRAEHTAYLVLQAVGFALPPLLPATRCALTAPFQPYLCPEGPSAVCFLRHFPAGHPGRPLAATAPCPARTFLRMSLNPATVQPTQGTIVTRISALHKYCFRADCPV